MSEDVQHVTQATSRVSVTIWSSGRRSAAWKTRVSEGADEDVVADVVARAVRAFRSVGEELGATEPRPSRDDEPAAS